MTEPALYWPEEIGNAADVRNRPGVMSIIIPILMKNANLTLALKRSAKPYWQGL